MSEFGAKKGIWIEKVLTAKMGDLEMLQIHFAGWSDLGVFKPQKGNGRRLRVNFYDF